MSELVDMFVQSDGMGEWDPPTVSVRNYPIEERLGLWRSKPGIVKQIFESHEGAYEKFCEIYGKEAADGIIAMADA